MGAEKKIEMAQTLFNVTTKNFPLLFLLLTLFRAEADKSDTYNDTIAVLMTQSLPSVYLSFFRLPNIASVSACTAFGMYGFTFAISLLGPHPNNLVNITLIDP
jgi:hypothetical protein